jgi:hypothetical protein
MGEPQQPVCDRGAAGGGVGEDPAGAGGSRGILGVLLKQRRGAGDHLQYIIDVMSDSTRQLAEGLQSFGMRGGRMHFLADDSTGGCVLFRSGGRVFVRDWGFRTHVCQVHRGHLMPGRSGRTAKAFDRSS